MFSYTGKYQETSNVIGTVPHSSGHVGDAVAIFLLILWTDMSAYLSMALTCISLVTVLITLLGVYWHFISLLGQVSVQVCWLITLLGAFRA